MGPRWTPLRATWTVFLIWAAACAAGHLFIYTPGLVCSMQRPAAGYDNAAPR